MTNIHLIEFDPSNESAFGSLESVSLTPVVQGDFVFGLNTQIWSSGSVTGTGASVDTDSSRLRIQSGTTSTGFAFITSRRSIRYRAGQGTVARFTPMFTSGFANNIQVWGMGTIVSNAPYDGYFFGYNGASFGIAHYNRGAATWYTQTSDWNGDKCDGSAGSSFTYQPDKGSPVMIKYPYLGFGDVEFFIQRPTTGDWVLCHRIQYANSTNVTQLSNPTLQFIGFTKNSGNTANKIMYCGSVGAFVSGIRSTIGNPKWSTKTNHSAVTAEINLLTLRNATTYNTVTNRGLIRISNISLSSSAATGVATFDLIVNATLGGAPSFATINGTTGDGGVTITSGNSVTSVDTAATISGGTRVFSFSVDSPNTQVVDLTPYEIFVAPSETLTVAGAASTSSLLGVSINWSEDI